MNNLEKLKVAIETEEEIKGNPEYKKFTQLLNECSKVKSSFAKDLNFSSNLLMLFTILPILSNSFWLPDLINFEIKLRGLNICFDI